MPKLDYPFFNLSIRPFFRGGGGGAGGGSDSRAKESVYSTDLFYHLYKARFSLF